MKTIFPVCRLENRGERPAAGGLFNKGLFLSYAGFKTAVCVRMYRNVRACLWIHFLNYSCRVTWYIISLFHCMLWFDASSCMCVFVCFFLSDHYFLIVSEYVFGCYGVSQGNERRSEQRALIRSDCVWLGSAVCRGWRTQRGCRGEK